MVENPRTRRKTGPRNVDWIAVHDLWTEGHGPDWIAERFGLTAHYVRVRLSWIDSHFPPTAPVRFKAALARRLDDALAALERGEPLEADRKAKALHSILRAAKAVEEWIMDNESAAQPAEPEPEATADDDPRAELERRIANLVAEEFKREPYTPTAGGAGAAHPDRGDGGGDPGDE
jgi:hypothetical protein